MIFSLHYIIYIPMENYDAIEIGKKIKEFRLVNNLSQQEIADAIGVSVLTYQNYESAKVSMPLDKFVKIAQFLKFNPNEILPFTFDLNITKLIYAVEQTEEMLKLLEKKANAEVKAKMIAKIYSSPEE